ncbi:hypothetical protein [Arcobacter sp.]|uniref:hypothetical protein n=1 Tax=unclassified Arcobacter TaxID=2593671 RepID=UPI003AFFE358
MSTIDDLNNLLASKDTLSLEEFRQRAINLDVDCGNCNSKKCIKDAINAKISRIENPFNLSKVLKEIKKPSKDEDNDLNLNR